ncbi:MAG: phosphotransferase [Thermoplasmata archaeon]|nr:phosphotransferase [Thermoplasmata archaeon]
MDTEFCKLAIETSFPDFVIHSIKANEIQGWDSFVARVNETHIFRFPTRPRVIRQLGFEIIILPELAKRLPIPIPNFDHIWHGDDERPQMFVGYPMIQGTVLSRTPPFEPARKKELASLLGRILIDIHTFPIEKALEAGMKPATPQTWRKDHENMQTRHEKSSFPLMDPKLREKCIEIFDEYLGNDDYFHFNAVLGHGDLSPDDHILWNPETEEITGIIDWGDMQIGDPALDFTGIICDCGPEFTDMVLAEYNKEMPDDPTIMERAAWYMKLFGFYFIEYGQLTKEDKWIEEGLEELRKS